MKELANRSAAGRPPARSYEHPPRRLAPACKAIVAASLLLPILVAGTAAAGGDTPLNAPAPGKWITIGGSHVTLGPAALWRGPDNRDWVVWTPNNRTYEVALLAPNGGVSKAATIALNWTGVASAPALVADGNVPLLVFSGQGPGAKYSRGCVVGALPGKPGKRWIPQTWSLSSQCDASNVGFGGAARNAKGVLSAAYAAIGGGILYRIGISNSIPAVPKDRMISIPTAGETTFTEAVDIRGNGHFYVAFNQFFSKPASRDGIYVKDLTANGPLTKAPGSGGLNPTLLQNVAFANSTAHGGVFAAYCSNDSTCNRVLLWRYGAKKALVVPKSAGARSVALASGPGGRLWVSWYNSSTNRLFTVRTNKADTRFGPVESYSIPVFDIQNFSIGGGNPGRLDVVLCATANNLKLEILTTQSLTALALSPGQKTIDNATANSVTFKVTDAGDPVAGALVSLAGHVAKTGASGAATIKFPKGAKPGKYTVTATATNYFSAGATLDITT